MTKQCYFTRRFVELRHESAGSVYSPDRPRSVAVPATRDDLELVSGAAVGWRLTSIMDLVRIFLKHGTSTDIQLKPSGIALFSAQGSSTLGLLDIVESIAGEEGRRTIQEWLLQDAGSLAEVENPTQ